MATTKTKKDISLPRIPPITIEGAQLIYKNFEGVGKQFNAKGNRNFNVVLNPKLATILEKDGWNVRWDDPKEEGDEARARLKVTVRFDNYPPRIVLVTKKGKSILDEESVGVLDWAEIDNADIIVTASPWSNADGKRGYKAYLKKGFFTLSENDLESKYSDVSSSRRNVDPDED